MSRKFSNQLWQPADKGPTYGSVVTFIPQIGNTSVPIFWCVTEMVELKWRAGWTAARKVTRNVSLTKELQFFFPFLPVFQQVFRQRFVPMELQLPSLLHTLLAGKRSGPNMPSGSKLKLIVGKHPRLMSSLNFLRGSDTFIPNESV